MNVRKIPFDYSRKPWFGPRSRAKKMLVKFAGVPSSKDQVIRELSVLGEASTSIQHVRLIEYRDKKSGVDYRLAICWVHSCPAARQLIYEVAEKFVEKTGWYPLPMGERLGLLSEDKDPPRIKLPSLAGGTRLVSLGAAVPPNQGCSIRIALSDGQSIVLDTGFKSRPDAGDCLVCLSHIHKDHSGGVLSGSFSALPVVMSAGTRRLLASRDESIDFASNCVTLDSGSSIDLSSSISLGMFPVPHLAGAVGFWLQDSETRVIFTGDISLRTSRHDFLPKLASLASENRNNIFLIDATMAGRKGGASRASISKIAANLDTDVVVIGETSEHLLYAYIDMFHQYQKTEKRHSASFVCSSDLRSLFRILHTPFMRRQLPDLDVFLAEQYGASMSAWAESRWLYWLDNLRSLPDGRKVYFLSLEEFREAKINADAKLLYVGRPINMPADHRVMDVDTTPWTLHSDADAVAEATRSLSGMGARVALFHNMTRRTKKFIADNSLNAEVVRFGSPIEIY